MWADALAARARGPAVAAARTPEEDGVQDTSRSRAPAGGLGTQGTTAGALPAGAANQGAKEGGGTVNLARTLGWVNGKNETEGGRNGR